MAERQGSMPPHGPMPPQDQPAPAIGEAVALAAAELSALGLDAPRLSAELLGAKAFGLTRLGLLVQSKTQLSQEALAAFRALVARRAKGEPVAYILGEKEFFGLGFRVTVDVLIPRPETEMLIEEAQRLYPADAPLRFADFGSGSGALAVALAHVFPQARGLAVDLSSKALDVARGNARRHQVEDRLEFLCADFTSLHLPAGALDLVVANPPYVTEAEYAALSPEVHDFEPRSALLSPDAGLAHIRGLAPMAARALRPGGVLLCEFGSSQGRAVLDIFEDPASGFSDPVVLTDYAGLDRMLRASRSAA